MRDDARQITARILRRNDWRHEIGHDDCASDMIGRVRDHTCHHVSIAQMKMPVIGTANFDAIHLSLPRRRSFLWGSAGQGKSTITQLAGRNGAHSGFVVSQEGHYIVSPLRQQRPLPSRHSRGSRRKVARPCVF